jgi:GntR family transcriptional regulator, arabinose operon transcriptional repressor
MSDYRFTIAKDSSLPLHEQLVSELRHAIISGIFKPHTRLPGELELVKYLGISRATVQRAWQTAQEEGLIYRVTGKGTFVADRPLEQGARKVGFLNPEYRGNVNGYLLSGAESILRANGYSVLYAHTDRQVNEENRLMREMIEQGVCGFLIWPAKGGANGRLLIDPRFNLPVVLMDRPIPGVALPCVTSNNHSGGLQAMRHLLELGHRRIVFLARPHLDLWPVAERLRAYEDAMRTAGLEPLPPCFLESTFELSWAEAYTQHDDESLTPIVDLLHREDRPTAVFAVNDWMAFKVLRAASLAGLRVPQDLSLVGFDNMDMVDMVDPPLTTVAQDTGLMGSEAARRLISFIEGEAVQEIMTLLPTRLVVRGSTAPPGS